MFGLQFVWHHNCREIVLLKSLWDTIVLVKSSFSNWNTTLWCDINVDQMEMDCKNFVKASHLIPHYTCVFSHCCMQWLTRLLSLLLLGKACFRENCWVCHRKPSCVFNFNFEGLALLLWLIRKCFVVVIFWNHHFPSVKRLEWTLLLADGCKKKLAVVYPNIKVTPPLPQRWYLLRRPRMIKPD